MGGRPLFAGGRWQSWHVLSSFCSDSSLGPWGRPPGLYALSVSGSRIRKNSDDPLLVGRSVPPLGLQPPPSGSEVLRLRLRVQSAVLGPNTPNTYPGLPSLAIVWLFAADEDVCPTGDTLPATGTKQLGGRRATALNWRSSEATLCRGTLSAEPLPPKQGPTSRTKRASDLTVSWPSPRWRHALYGLPPYSGSCPRIYACPRIYGGALSPCSRRFD